VVADDLARSADRLRFTQQAPARHDPECLTRVLGAPAGVLRRDRETDLVSAPQSLNA